MFLALGYLRSLLRAPVQRPQLLIILQTRSRRQPRNRPSLALQNRLRIPQSMDRLSLAPQEVR